MPRNAAEFRAALAGFHAPQQNMVFADRDGAIGFVAAGLVPIRRALDAGSQLPVPGWTGEYDWTGFVPFDGAAARNRNPPRGWIATANNRIVGDDYPYFIAADCEVGYRIRRIRELLDGRSGLTPDDMAAMQRRYAVAGRRASCCRCCCRRSTTGRHARPGGHRPAARLEPAMDRGQAAPLIFTAWLRALHARSSRRALGALYDEESYPHSPRPERLLAGDPPPLAGWCDDPATPVAESCPAAPAPPSCAALETLAEALRRRPDAWRWGAAHRAPFANPLLSRHPGDRALPRHSTSRPTGPTTRSTAPAWRVAAPGPLPRPARRPTADDPRFRRPRPLALHHRRRPVGQPAVAALPRPGGALARRPIPDYRRRRRRGADAASRAPRRTRQRDRHDRGCPRRRRAARRPGGAHPSVERAPRWPRPAAPPWSPSSSRTCNIPARSRSAARSTSCCS